MSGVYAYGADAAGLPAVPGAYALLIRLGRGVSVHAGALGEQRFAAGLYVYAGSARGPGGIRARVTRHLRQGKRMHWHIDRFLPHGRVMEIAAVEGGSECAVIAALTALPGTFVPAAGFGSSDCRRCAAHLVVVPRGTVLAAAIPPRA